MWFHPLFSSVNQRGQRTYLKELSEEGILAWGGKDKKQGREAGFKHTTPSGAPKALVLPGLWYSQICGALWR